MRHRHIGKGALMILTTFVLALTFTTAPAKKPNDKGKGGGSGHSLCVTFDDGGANNITSDGGGDYCDGVEAVSAEIDKFRFSLNVSMEGALRNFLLDFGDCISAASECVGNTLEPIQGWNIFSTNPDGAQFLKMENGDSQFVDFQVDFFDGNGRLWRVQFTTGENCPEGTDMATVTKTGLDVWEFAADIDDVACLQLREGGRRHFEFHGLYHMPFSLEALAQ